MQFRSVCLSGGGVTGVAHVGMLQKLHDEQLEVGIDTIVGTSAGAIVGTLYTIGMAPSAIFEALLNVDKSSIFRFENIEYFLTSFGLDDGRYFMAHMADLFLSINVDPRITFSQVFKQFKKRIIITGTNTSSHKPEYFQVDTVPDMRVLDAVRISMSIPLLFTAISRSDGLYVDGAVLDNYPIKYCIEDFSSRYPLAQSLFGVIGCALDSLPPKTTPDLESFIFNVFASSIKCSRDETHTVNVFLDELSSVDFEATSKKLSDAFKLGYHATSLYLGSLRKKARLHITRRRSI